METFEDHLESTNPDPRFNFIVEDILRDKQSGWSHNYYSNSASQWSIALAKQIYKVAQMQQTINKNATVIEFLSKQIQNSKLPSNHKDFKPLKKDEFAKVEANYIEVVKENIYLADDMKDLKKDIDKYSYLDYICSTTNQNIYKLRNKFQLDGDLEYLKQGITLANLLYYKHLDKDLPPLRQPSWSAW